MKLASVIFAGVFATIAAIGSAHALCTNATLAGSYGSVQYQGIWIRDTSHPLCCGWQR